MLHPVFSFPYIFCVQVVIDAGDTLWQRKDPDGILALTRLIEAGFLRLADADPGLCAAKLPRAVHALTPQVWCAC